MAKFPNKPTTKTTSLLEIAVGAAKTGRPAMKSWIDLLPPDQRTQVVEFARHFNQHGGNKSAVIAAWRKAGLDVSKHKLDLLLERVASGEIQ